jgi:uncharacterized protein (DUF736 family)
VQLRAVEAVRKRSLETVAYPLWRDDPTKPRIPCGSNLKGNTMIIGNFKHDAKANTYAGDITTLTFHRNDVQLRPVEKKSAEKEPDYRVIAKTASGTVEFGAAWKRTSDRGQEFLSVSIDDPSLSGALNAALFPAENGEDATLVWNRLKPKKKAA